MKKMFIELGGERATALLYEDKAPELCEKVWNCLPWETDVHHATLVERELIFMMPFIQDAENSVIPTPGDIGWWNWRSSVNIFYDEMKPLGPTSLFGRLVDNVEGFKKEARKVWFRSGKVKIRLSKAGE